jgi:PIN domain nuclease of toxin-antitoxin system
LDTHVLVWWSIDEKSRLNAAWDLIADPSNEIFVSAISLWEIAIKTQLGRMGGDVARLRSTIAPAGFADLPFLADDAAEIAKLPPIHRDPFDRALIAQARCQGLRLLTADEKLSAYGESVLPIDSLG